MATKASRSAATQHRDLTELRLLVELPALRKLADRGLCDQELAVIRNLANATARSARSGDVRGYLRSDTAFHLHLLELTGDRAVSEVARLLLSPGPMQVPRFEESRHLVTAGAREHRELVDMLTDDMGRAADDLLRQHISRPRVSRPAPMRSSSSRMHPQ